jgi:hypothetical protein
MKKKMKYLLLKLGSSLQTKILVIFISGKQEETRLEIYSSWKTCYWVLA